MSNLLFDIYSWKEDGLATEGILMYIHLILFML